MTDITISINNGKNLKEILDIKQKFRQKQFIKS